MKRLLTFFLRGLVLTVPIVVTIAVCWIVLTRVDGWLGLSIPGAGFVITIAGITLIGFLGSTFLWTQAERWLDELLNRLPFVRLLYSSTKDLLNAFVGEKRRFDEPVLVALSQDRAVRTLGFITQRSLAGLGLPGDVAVYFPQSYNFAGQLVVVPGDRVTRLDAPSSDVLAFIVSGGVTDVPEAKR
jgi:uncharacterized membrane protein